MPNNCKHGIPSTTDRVAKFIHWTLCKHYEILHTEKWYEHTPEPVVEGKNVTMLWDFNVHTDRKIDVNRSDIIIKNHDERTCIMMDVIWQYPLIKTCH